MIKLLNVFWILVLTTILHQSYGSVGTLTTSGTACPKTPMFNYLADYIKLWVTVKVCDHVAASKVTMDADGRIYISFRTLLKPRENTDNLCKCIQEYWFQGPWTKDAKSICYTECGTLTLLLIGSPHPEFVGAKSVLEGVKPIDALAQAVEIYGNGQVWEYKKCFGKPGINEQGFKHVMWTCIYSGSNLPTVTELCTLMYDYINGGDGNFLGDTVNHYCWVQNKTFYLDIVAKEK